MTKNRTLAAIVEEHGLLLIVCVCILYAPLLLLSALTGFYKGLKEGLSDE